MKLVIAEKPSLAKTIREAVGKEYTVTNAFGHIYELADPDIYLPDDLPRNARGGKKWRMEDLPIIPQKWLMRQKDDAKEQIATIAKLLKTADEVINAGDPDREGQLLIDEILIELGYRGPVKRVWLTSLQPDAVRTAFKNMRPNSEYKPLFESAAARSRADWLIGMNLTRAYTLRNGALLSIGRVQTPTLKLIVDRDLTIEHFKPVDYFTVQANVQRLNVQAFTATWKPASTDVSGFDAEGRLVDRALADTIAKKAAGTGTVVDYKADKKKRAAPLPMSLNELQKAASAKYGMSAKAVLDSAQRLYEQQLTSYPRSDCRYLGNDQYDELLKVAQSLALGYSVEVEGRKHAAFDDSKVTAHTAIVPTGASAARLDGLDAKIYDLIARATLAMFMPDEEYFAVSAMVECGGEQFVATGKRVTVAGWTALYGKDKSDEDEAVVSIPELSKGDSVTLSGAEVIAKQTKPPARFNDGSLIDAMSNIHKFVDDPAARAKLKETSGIGTVATRANVIETLAKRGWITKNGKNMVSTADGRAVIKALPDELTSPATTARWEDLLGMVAEGKLDVSRFDAAIVEMLREQIGIAKGKSQITAGTLRTAPKGAKTDKCTVCGKQATRWESKNKPGTFYWRCENPEHGLLGDDKGKPGKEFQKKG